MMVTIIIGIALFTFFCFYIAYSLWIIPSNLSLSDHTPEYTDFNDLISDAVEAIIAQGKKSTEGSTCVYRGPSGMKCLVGMCISDEHYNKKMEGNVFSVSDLVKDAVANSHPSIDFTDKEYTVLSYLQTCHDGAMSDDFVRSFKSKVRHFIEIGKLPEHLMHLVKE